MVSKSLDPQSSEGCRGGGRISPAARQIEFRRSGSGKLVAFSSVALTLAGADTASVAFSKGWNCSHGGATYAYGSRGIVRKYAHPKQRAERIFSLSGAPAATASHDEACGTRRPIRQGAINLTTAGNNTEPLCAAPSDPSRQRGLRGSSSKPDYWRRTKLAFEKPLFWAADACLEWVGLVSSAAHEG